MENSERTHRPSNNGVKMDYQWFNDAMENMLELYKNQIDFVYNFYGKAFNSMINANKNPFWSNKTFMDLFDAKGNMKSFFELFPWNRYDEAPSFFSHNPFLTYYKNLGTQFAEYNQNLLSSFQNDMKDQQNKWTGLNERYQELASERLQGYRNIISAMNAAVVSQLEFSMQNNNKLFSDVNKEFSELLRSNQEFWTELVKSAENQTRDRQKTSKRETVHA